jgi:adenosylhomocysteine nucleosidase
MPSAPAPLVVFAVPEETKAFLRLVRPTLRAAGESETLLTHALGHHSAPEIIWPSLRVLTTGMGVRHARQAFEASCQKARPGLVLTCGFAGGLDSQLPLGAVLVDADAGFPLIDGLRNAGALPGAFHCAARVAVTVAEKAALRQATGADAVEMESYVIRACCRERGIPSATVRVISDTAKEDLPLDFNALMTPDYRMDFLKLAWRLTRSPGKIPELIRFQKRVSFAADRLAATLANALAVGA